MKEFEPYLKQIKEGKLKEPKEKRTHDFKLLIERTGLTLEEANDLLTLACMKDSNPELSKKLLFYSKVK